MQFIMYFAFRSILVPLISILLMIGSVAPAAIAADPSVAVLVSAAGAPYEEALSGFRQYLQAKGIKADIAVHQLAGDAAKAASVVSSFRKSPPKLVVTLGMLATENVLRETPDIPVVAAMILKSEVLKKADNATGVVLEISLVTQLQWLKKVMPKATTIGIIFNPAENREKIDAVARIAQKMGLKVSAQEVRSPTDIPGALERLASDADVMLGISDSLVLTPQTAKLILLFSFRNKIPFIGPSAAWVKAGALYALDGDYADMGAQCGEAAVKILQGTPASSIPLGTPRKTVFTLNRKTAEEMSLSIPDDIAREAKVVY